MAPWRRKGLIAAAADVVPGNKEVIFLLSVDQFLWLFSLPPLAGTSKNKKKKPSSKSALTCVCERGQTGGRGHVTFIIFTNRKTTTKEHKGRFVSAGRSSGNGPVTPGSLAGLIRTAGDWGVDHVGTRGGQKAQDVFEGQ